MAEQTGIFAGSGGFDVTVGEHTQLNGAVIASTAAADKNKLDTGTLGFGNIENHADYKVEHQSAGISTGGSVGGQFAGNMANGMLAGLNDSGSADSVTKAAVSEGTIVIRDKEKQAQDVADLSRDVENANPGLETIFDKEKEQNRLKAAQLIGEIGSQAGDIARTQGEIIATRKANDKMSGVTQTDRDRALAELKAKDPTKQYSADDVSKQVYSNFYNQAFADSGFGTGGKVQRAISAVTAAVQGLSGGNVAQAISGASAPYLAEKIHELTTDANGKVNTEANLMAHAVLGAVTSYAAGNSALAGASGAAMGEYIAQQLYPGVKRSDLSEEQRQTISALGTLAAGLAGGVVGDSTADAVAGAQAGKNAVENNYLSVSDKTELEIAKQKLNSKDPAERERAQQKYDALREKDIASDKEVIDACGNGNVGSSACAGARLKVIATKEGYEDGPYNSKYSQQYADAYGNIVNLLNITSVDAQNQQQVKDAMVNYAMVQLGVDKATAENYIETYDGMKTVAASMTPVLGAAAVSKLSKLAEKVVVYPSGINFRIDQPKHLATVDGFTQKNGISGGHNSNAFYDAAKEYNVKIVSETPTGVKGITEVKYLIPTKDRAGHLTGNYKAVTETKTIYDPKIFSDQ
ncbi:VENN motif pre-toxin domain-containing protein [Pantoea sp. USHLN298]|uniref:VENN motif pre-toxin domain-containing protein n=1 Tax=Pantoea sp. USHLN298 TaxID=3081294 RepID=UPI003FA7E826